MNTEQASKNVFTYINQKNVRKIMKISTELCFFDEDFVLKEVQPI